MLRAPLLRPGHLLHERMASDTIAALGVYDALSALVAESKGAKALYLSGAALTAARLGLPDVGFITQTEFAQAAAEICSVVRVPVLADSDTGFGEAWNVARTVVAYERAGLAGLHLEDQVNPKRCGHLDGKELVSTAAMCQKIRAAISAKRDKDFLIVARTDARGVEGLEPAIARAQAYVEAGADSIFPEGLESEAEFEAFRSALEVPLVANMTEFGKTPLIPLSRFGELGYSLVLFPVTALRIVQAALEKTYATILETGSQATLLDEMATRADLYETLGYSNYTLQDERWSR